MMRLCRRTSRHGTKDCIRHAIDDLCNLIIGFTVRHAGDNVTEAGKDLQTITAANKTNIVRVQSQPMVLSNDHGSRRYS